MPTLMPIASTAPRPGLSATLKLALIVAGTLLVYVPFLASIPIYLAPDEIFFGINAHSRDRSLSGRYQRSGRVRLRAWRAGCLPTLSRMRTAES